MRKLLSRATLGGVAAAAAVLAFELWLVARKGSLSIDVAASEAWRNALEAARHDVAFLVVRAALLYLAAGAASGAAGALGAASLLGRRRVAERPGAALALAFGLWAALWASLLARASALRPALLSDLPFGLGALSRAAALALPPWLPALTLAALASACAAPALWRARAWRPPRTAYLVVPSATLLALSAARLWARFSGSASHPLVVLLSVDALRPDRLERGHTPHLDAFLADAVRFDAAYTPLAQTQPAWRSLLTAVSPIRHGLRYALASPLVQDQSLPTLPGLLAARGWSTAFHGDCSRFNPMAGSGFSTVHEPPPGAYNFVLEAVRLRGIGLLMQNALGDLLFPEVVQNRALAGQYDPLRWARTRAAHLLEQARRGPALFALHTTVPHFPGDPPWPFWRRWSGPGDPPLSMTYRPVLPGELVRRTANERALERERQETLYENLLATSDAMVGEIFAALRAARLWDEALVVVMSDHGESFHEGFPAVQGALSAHGARLSDLENRVVLAMKFPRSMAITPRRITAPVRLFDVAPTVLDALDLPPLPGAEGVSLMPLARGEARDLHLVVYAETGLSHVDPAVYEPSHRRFLGRDLSSYTVDRATGEVSIKPSLHADIVVEKDRMVLVGRMALVRAPLEDGATDRLFDFAADPAALRDLAPANPLLAARLSRLLDAADPSGPRPAPGPGPQSSSLGPPP